MAKYQILMEELRLLGHLIKGHRITPLPERISKILDWKEPTNKKELQSFLGVLNYIAPHLPHSSTILAPLTELTGNAQWRWDSTQSQAFNQIKKLCNHYIPLSPINYDKVWSGEEKIYLITDASRVGVGAILSHGTDLEDAKGNIAALHSRKFTSALENYTTTDQELLAIVDALIIWENKLLGTPFTVVTDHKALEYLMHKPINNARTGRWLEYLQRFQFDILHTPESINTLADILSRLYEDCEKEKVPSEQYVNEETTLSKEDSPLFNNTATTTDRKRIPINWTFKP